MQDCLYKAIVVPIKPYFYLQNKSKQDSPLKIKYSPPSL